MRSFYRFPLFIFTLASYFAVASIFHLCIKDQWQQRRIVAKINKFYAKLVLSLVGVRLNVKGKPSLKSSALLVGNHMSYLDIFLVAAIYPTSFVTSVEMKNTPLLGHVCRMGGCLFVERRNKNNIEKEILEITEALKKGFLVTIFPEATSTNGDEVIRFRKPLYNAALYAKKDVQPFCIEYKSINGNKVTKENRDHICWYDNMAFLGHFLRLLNQKFIDIDFTFTEKISYQENKDLNYFVESSHSQVKEIYQGFSEVEV